ncbi:twin-arginine translocation pathway signal protein [Salegentibacter sp. BLCTC]|uniref:alkaline phosphatase D family protein n=1 Tax=Salegentibacter sp. BLCTC TaxID=2697368 RepID=UPI00187B1936|nr:alkaline phosphatase D family protein [Salegentibacter sp. BLCTC]MBE7640009.1 twin-arginine translocation pathway signal protein [Salegentibacter sp. BLCTC]
MDRRKYIKTISLGAIAPAFIPGALNLEKIWGRPQEVLFRSNWENWPDIKWVGPEYWGNRLQDWQLKDAKAICRVKEKNRSLHLLTLQKPDTPETFQTQVNIHLPEAGFQMGEGSCIGMRLGAKGRFEDYRSSAVFGQGVDIGLSADGDIKVGDTLIPTSLESWPKELNLKIKALAQNNKYLLEITLKDLATGNKLFSDKSTNLPSQSLAGNFALLSHIESTESTSEDFVAFADWEISSEKLQSKKTQLFGPICFAQYTLHNQKLKLTAQCTPFEAIDGHQVYLDFFKDGQWQREQSTKLPEVGSSFKASSRAINFVVPKWEFKEAIPYRVVAEIPLKSETIRYEYKGTIAREPKQKEEVKAAVFSCNFDYGFPDNDVVSNMGLLNPDIIMFLGDQFYEGTGGFGATYNGNLEETSLDYLRKWYMFGWSYRELFRHKPCAIIPDDHDVYHGNVWGESGKNADTSKNFGAAAQDSGGYKMPADWVNMIQFTQTSHLPDPFDPTPVKQGINVYYTHWNYGGISFAILEDRKFKSAPKNVLPKEAKVWNGFITNPDFDIKKHKNIEAELLGKRQHKFLEDWVEDWENGAEMKAVLSQTNFATVATLPKNELTDQVVPSLAIPEKGKYVEGDDFTVDMDSNGWPANKRDEAITIIRKAFAFHIAGDQHLGSFIQYGVQNHGDSGYAFAGPALNNIWPRRFWPPVDFSKHTFKKPSYTGDFIDGFGNKLSVLAVANPHKSTQEPKILSQRATGYGLVTFNKEKRTIKTECWPRLVKPTPENQNPGWPITISQQDNYARKAIAWLPELRFKTNLKPVISVFNDKNELIYSIKINTKNFKPKVFEKGTYTVKIFFSKEIKSKIFKNMVAKENNTTFKQINTYKS